MADCAESHKLLKVISGGQTGADTAGLLAAKAKGIKTGGTAPEGYKTENGPNIKLKREFGLEERGGYKSRTKENVDRSDATLCLIVHDGKGGTSKTAGYSQTKTWTDSWTSKDNGYRPTMVINILKEKDIEKIVQKIRDWIVRNQIKILNVAGHRQSTAFDKKFFPQEPFHYQNRCQEILEVLFSSLK